MGASGLGSRAVIGTFYQRLMALTAASWAPKIAWLQETQQDRETYKWLGMSPALREWVGGRQAKGLREDGITIVNKTFEATLDLNVDEIRRDQTGQSMVRVQELAERASEHVHQLISTAITDNGLCYDGQNFFDTDHVSHLSGTQINAIAAAHVASLNIGTATAPTADEFATALLDVIAYMMKYADDQGQPMNHNAKSWLVMVPANLWAPAVHAIYGKLLTTSAGAARDNILQSLGLQIEPVYNPRLASSASAVWYIFRTDTVTKPFIDQEELFEVSSDDKEEFTNNRILFGVKAIRAVGYGYWQYAASCTFS